MLAQPSFGVTAIWDEDARVWTCDSDIVGLYLEARSLTEVFQLVAHFAPGLIADNHFPDQTPDFLI